jgi:hypothetical protein
MDPKLALMFLLIGTVIGLSRLGQANSAAMRRQPVDRRWHNFLRGRHKI